MDPYFSEIGRTVLERWKRADFSLPAFPGIARVAMEERPPAKWVDLSKLTRNFLLEEDQPFQSSSGFGQPELILFDHPKFYIQLLFWLDGTTDIHQHEFSGAFHVLSGSSIHSRFEFNDRLPVTGCFQVGNLELTQTDLLETGATVEIVSGRGCIHSLFHLETPSVTVVIRTHSDPGTGPQFTYLPPHIALDPVQNDALTIRRKQLLDVLERTGDPTYLDLVKEMVADLDFERGFFILQNCIGHLRELEAWDEVWAIFAQKHGSLADSVASTLREIIRRDQIVAMRGSIEDVDHRFFLALLLNVQNRAAILSMVGQRYPGEAMDTIMGWAEELTQFTETGTWIIDAQSPEILSLTEDDSLFLAVLGVLLKGADLTGTMRKLSAEDIQAMRDAFAQSSWQALILREKAKP